MATNTAALRKRAQIAKANRTMFLWIAVSSAIVGSAVVVSFFLGRQLLYNEKILAEKNNTVSQLEKNNAIVPELQTEIRVLDTNEALAAAKANQDNQTIQVILDALPSDANSLALGASLQSKLLTGVDGLVVESLQVDPVFGLESLDETGGAAASASEITFQFAVSGSEAALKQVLTNLERSIRLIDIRSLVIESQGERQVMTVRARAFFEPAKTIELKDKVVE